jgi:DNA-binding MarR family transcriptional regulator
MHLPADLPPPGTERLRLMQEVRLGLLEVAERLRQNWHAHAAAAGLSTAQVNALLSLTPGEAVPMRSLAARLDYDASNLSVLVDRLERRGLVERRPDPGDRRVKALALTSEGERLRATFWSDLLEDAGPLAPLADSELEGFAVLLGVLGVGDPVRGAADPASSGRR